VFDSRVRLYFNIIEEQHMSMLLLIALLTYLVNRFSEEVPQMELEVLKTNKKEYVRKDRRDESSGQVEREFNFRPGMVYSNCRMAA